MLKKTFLISKKKKKKKTFQKKKKKKKKKIQFTFIKDEYIYCVDTWVQQN